MLIGSRRYQPFANFVAFAGSTGIWSQGSYCWGTARCLRAGPSWFPYLYESPRPTAFVSLSGEPDFPREGHPIFAVSYHLSLRSLIAVLGWWDWSWVHLFFVGWLCSNPTTTPLMHSCSSSLICYFVFRLCSYSWIETWTWIWPLKCFLLMFSGLSLSLWALSSSFSWYAHVNCCRIWWREESAQAWMG